MQADLKIQYRDHAHPRGGGRRLHDLHAEAERRMLLADHESPAAAERDDSGDEEIE